MELILQGNEICFSPTMQEVCDMIISVVYEVMLALFTLMDINEKNSRF